MSKHISNNKGFTLIEIIITLAILSMVIFPITSLLLTGYKINNAGEIEYEASMIAQGYMEMVKSWDILIPSYTKEYFGYNSSSDEGDKENFKTKLLLKKVDNYGNKQPGTSSDNYDLSIGRSDGFVTFKSNNVLISQIIETDEFDINFDNDELIINGTNVLFNYNGSISPAVSVHIDKNIKINARNNTNKIIKVDIIRDRVSNYKCDFNILNGEIKKRVNIYDSSFIKSAENILYEVLIEVSYKNEEIVKLTGYKVFN